MSQTPNQPSPADCARAQELIPAYSLGATDPDETALVESRLADCPDAQAELAEYRALAEVMLYSAPPAKAPAHIAARLMEAARPPAAPPRALFQPVAVRRAGRWLAAAVLLLALTNLYWLVRFNEAQGDKERLSDRVAEHETLLAQIGIGEARQTTLPTAVGGQETGAYATVIWNPASQTTLIYAEDFPALPPDKVYQVWLIRGEARVSGGLFRVDESGRGKLLVWAPEPLGQFEAIGITPEPSTGSDGPTTPPVVRGNL